MAGGKYEFYMDEAQEWYDAAYGYSKDDPRYDDCIKKAHHYYAIAAKFNTREFFNLETALDMEFNKMAGIDNIVTYYDYDSEETQMLMRMRKTAEAQWKKLKQELEDYERKVLD